MRVVVVGASGNVGTALLRRLRHDPTVLQVVGVARRIPVGDPRPPYDIAAWHGVDVGAPGPSEPVVARLARVFAGADAVVHLAWAVQPSHDRRALRRVNVDGTRRVLDAVVRAGVPHLVAASSVGAYSPADPGGPDLPRDESWPTGGVRASDHSLDKVSQEVLLDETAGYHPELTVARLRPALVFQRAAAARVGRSFLGPLVPRRMLDGGVPVLPWPAGLRLQAVHADDLAGAYREAVVRRVRGAFNVAAPGVLGGQQVADVVAGGRWREVDPAVARRAMRWAWYARALPVRPGWLDLGLGAPLLDCARAERELDWRPRRTAVQAFAELVAGLAARAAGSSPPLRR